MKKLIVCLPLVWACGGSEAPPHKELFPPKPECMGDPIVPYAGTFPTVISQLQIGSAMDGFDLDGDGKPDNKLAAVGSLAQDAINTSFQNYEIVIPLEFFNLPTVAQTDCVKFAIYLADYDKDSDGDGKRPGIAGGDCNDTANGKNIFPGATEIVGDGIDNDCDGLADEDAQNMPNTTDTMDRDHDGQTVAQGDCDDTNPNVYKGHPEICGDGLDNDCDGVADRSTDAMGNVTACSAYDATRDLVLDPLALDMTGKPVIAFTSGTIDSAMNIEAGPGLFSVNIPVMAGLDLDLKITGTTIEGTLAADGSTQNGRLGGVIDARTADTIRGLNVDAIMLTPDDSLLDATFANVLGDLLALPKSKNPNVIKKYPGCKTPDIDVDGDGLEAFCDSNPNDNIKTVDVCIDGDGTEIHDEVDANGVVTKHCTEALDAKGNPRFVDGISVELNFKTTKIHSIKPPAT